MISNKMTQGFFLGIFTTVFFILLVASNSEQTNSSLERRVTALENRVTNLESLSSIGTNQRLNSTSSVNNWRKLEIGMTMAQVRRLLGEPKRVDNLGFIIMWSIEGGGTVSFSGNRVESWSEPYR